MEGIWHTAVVAYGREYFFGPYGIQSSRPVSIPKQLSYCITQMEYSSRRSRETVQRRGARNWLEKIDPGEMLKLLEMHVHYRSGDRSGLVLVANHSGHTIR